jgi:hypothetical protein
MHLTLIGHPDIEAQIGEVFKADRRHGPLAVARIKAVIKAYEDEPSEEEPAPVAQYRNPLVVALQAQGKQDLVPQPLQAEVTIYVYEAWSLRFAIARVCFPSNVVVAALLMVETAQKALQGLSSGNLAKTLIGKVEELTWPI